MNRAVVVTRVGGATSGEKMLLSIQKTIAGILVTSPRIVYEGANQYRSCKDSSAELQNGKGRWYCRVNATLGYKCNVTSSE